MFLYKDTYKALNISSVYSVYMVKTKMIRLHESTKKELDSLGMKNESYNDIVINLIKLIRNKENKVLKGEIINFYAWARKYGFLKQFWIYCQDCNKKKAVEMHHIDKNQSNNVIDNLELLCHKCHIKAHYDITDSLEKKKKQIKQLDKKTNELIKVWSGLREASRELKIDVNSISACCNGRYKTAGGFIWKFNEVQQ